jgi:hypothetical protein
MPALRKRRADRPSSDWGAGLHQPHAECSAVASYHELVTTCQLCGLPKKFIKAHVIPEAFFRAVRAGDAEAPLLVTAGQYPRRAPIGVYDKRILCIDCEQRFADLDAFAARVLLQDFGTLFSPITGPAGVVGFESTSVDARLLLRFLVSVLWRASVSREPFYHRVDLGPYRKLAEQFCLEDQDDHGVFDAGLWQWADDARTGAPTLGMTDPFRHDYDGVTAYRVYLGRVAAEIKVAKKPFLGVLAELGLRAAPPVRVVIREFHKSKELAVMAKTAKLALVPHRRPRPS